MGGVMMTKEEAIRLIGWLKCTTNREDDLEAIDMAIEALTEPKTIIGIDIPYGSDKGIATLFKSKDDKLILEEVKEIMSVVRCKDCKWYMLTDHNETEVCTNKQWDISMAVYPIISADDFCSYGERREPTIPMFKESEEAYKAWTGEEMGGDTK